MALTAPVRVLGRCQGCGARLLTCPQHAVRPDGLPASPYDLLADGPDGGPDGASAPGPLLVVSELCTGCLECVEVCPVDAVDVVEKLR